MQTTLVSRSEQETLDFGRTLAESLPIPARLLLVGDLGAGKTTLTRGLAAGFGVDPDDVSSPTFTLVNRYSGRIPVYHIDLYRIGPDETFELGLDEILDDPRAAVIIEWAERLGDQEVDGAWRVTLSWVDSRTRRIEMLTAGRRQP
jgi:tRNA threonylcarbamoyladenosine biosynthesis protein TsaE